ncbi:5-formyltetrahydrofolate cyclo-ligase [Saccharicrinis sp. FJH54]|uniref:5-formyltetrahydrofolate cyclo-ligase n=1 Tax=Saccharicrinis sp. FJH54 TaxID=3344665 RepID=UPI0035D52548
METSKPAVRKEIREKTASLTSEEKLSLSDRATYLLENDPLFKNAEIIAMYWSLDDEVNTHRFIEKWNGKKTILLPVIEGANIYFATYDGMKDMVKEDRFGVLQPENSNIYNIKTIDLIVVPGVAFDRKNNRLGRGKGYYDRALSESRCPKVGICFPHQYVEQLPVDIHDIKVDKVVFA